MEKSAQKHVLQGTCKMYAGDDCGKQLKDLLAEGKVLTRHHSHQWG